MEWPGPALGVPAFLALGGMATAETLTRAAAEGTSVQRTLVLCLVALATTIPPAFAGRAAGTISIAAAQIASLALFHALTVAAPLALVGAVYALAMDGEAWIAVGLTPAFPALVLARPVPAGSEAGVLAVLLAAGAPAAAFAGVARRAQGEAVLQDAARRTAVEDVMEHAARGERVRIARELHDVVAHHISMVAVEAETARVATPGMPAAGARRLASIGDTARLALTEMRRLLGVLREDAGGESAERRPQPGIEQLAELLDEVRAASGCGARLIFEGSPRALDPGVELAAYRIVQEALTNARRHAPGAGVDVELRFGELALRLRVRDTGPGPPPVPDAAGHGLAGMSERAAAVGGELRTGPAPGGGFLVEAMLPVSSAAA